MKQVNILIIRKPERNGYTIRLVLRSHMCILHECFVEGTQENAVARAYDETRKYGATVSTVNYL